MHCDALQLEFMSKTQDLPNVVDGLMSLLFVPIRWLQYDSERHLSPTECTQLPKHTLLSAPSSSIPLPSPFSFTSPSLTSSVYLLLSFSFFFPSHPICPSHISVPCFLFILGRLT